MWPLASGDESSLAGLYMTLSPGYVSHPCTNASNGLELLDVQSTGARFAGRELSLAKSFLAGDWLLGLC